MIPTDEQIDRWTLLAHNERLSVQKGINKTKNTSLRSPKDRPARREFIETIVSLYLMEGGLDEGGGEWIKASDELPTKQDADDEGFVLTFGRCGRSYQCVEAINSNGTLFTHWMKTPAPPAK